MAARRTFIRRLAAACAIALAAGGALAQTCASPSTPSGARVEMVAPDMLANGVAMTVRAVESKLSVDELLAYYRQLWAPLATDTRPGSMENEANGWRVISTLQGRCFTTVQVKSRLGGSYALVAVSRKPEASLVARTAIDFPMLPGSRILNDLGYAEPVRNARTVVVANSARMSTNVEFYASELTRRGWVLMMRQQAQGPKGLSEVIVLKKGTEEMNVVIAPAAGGQVTIVANLVDRP